MLLLACYSGRRELWWRTVLILSGFTGSFPRKWRRKGRKWSASGDRWRRSWFTSLEGNWEWVIIYIKYLKTIGSVACRYWSYKTSLTWPFPLATSRAERLNLTFIRIWIIIFILGEPPTKKRMVLPQRQSSSEEEWYCIYTENQNHVSLCLTENKLKNTDWIDLK